MSNNAPAGPVNLGNPHESTIEELAHEVLRLVPSSSSITYAALPADDPQRRRPDISLARQALGWEPRVALAQGLERTVGYFRTQGVGR